MALIPMIVLMMACFLSGAALSLLPRRGQWNFWGSLAAAGLGSLIVLGCGIYFIIWPMQQGMLVFNNLLPVGGLPSFAISIYIDRLAALFLILTGGLSMVALLHMFDCLAEVTDRSRIVAAYNLFILSITFTILANAVYMFLFALECITLSYAYLVLFQHNQDIEATNLPGEAMKPAKTAFKSYLIFDHIGFTLLAMALMLISIQTFGQDIPAAGCQGLRASPPGALGFDFDMFRCFAQQNSRFSGPAADLIFLLALFGFGIKAGMFPMHVWVPLVHPFSPSSFPALMSAVGLTVSGLYGMYRVFFEFMRPGAFWWGLLILLLAGASALVGAFYGMLGRDLKTALASYSTTHVGVILTGIGLAMIYRWAEQYAAGVMTLRVISGSFRLLTVLALIASLYHLLNYAIFQSLLSFASGAIENRTGTTMLDRLGGLVKRYPWISAMFMVGALSTAGLPPFNGFASEWMTLQAMFGGMYLLLPAFGPRIYFLAGLVVALLCLALAFGLTVLGFVKIAGGALLGVPRNLEVVQHSKVREVSWRIRSGLAVLAVLCLGLGLLPSITAHGLSQVARDFSGFSSESPLGASTLNLAIEIVSPGPLNETSNKVETAAAGYQVQLPGRLLFGTAGVLVFPFLLNVVLRSVRKGKEIGLHRGPIWTGGSPYRPEVMQVTGSAFSSPVWMALETQNDHPASPAGLFEEAAGRVFQTMEPLTEQRAVPEYFRALCNYAAHRLGKASQRFGDWAQPGDLRRYLLYILAIFLMILAALLILNGPGGMQ